jgi:signal transduction histidine kinase
MLKESGFIFKHDWLKELSLGKVDVAYNSFIDESKINKYIINYSPSFRYLAVFLSRSIPVQKIIENSGEAELDMAPELILFWKKSDHVGFRLLVKIYLSLLLRKPISLRSLFWFAHWLGFQGEYSKATQIFEACDNSQKINGRLLGEFYSLYGNLEFCLKKVDSSILLHEKARRILKECEDNFFLLYNLGISAKSYALTDNSLQFKKHVILEYDSLDPESPDLRYGMRVLMYLAYLYNQEGEALKSSLYMHSAKIIYDNATSEIDKCVYSIYMSLILFSNYDFKNGFFWISIAEDHLNRFGKYQIYEDQIQEIKDFFSGEGTIKDGILTHFKSSSFKKDSDSTSVSWSESFVNHFYELAHASSINDLKSAVIKITLAQDLILCPIEESCYLGEELKVFSSDSQLTFNIYFKDSFFNVKLTAGVEKWLNRGVFDNITKTMELAQSIYNQRYFQGQLERGKREIALAERSKQLAHDIRSPLAALDVSIKDLEQVKPEQRHLIRSAINRIHDIANDLSGKVGALDQGKDVRSILLSSLLSSIVSEKRIEFRNISSVNIDFSFRGSNYGLFSNISPNGFKRVVSNLVNNSVESIKEKKGFVEVKLHSYGSHHEVLIIDNGAGIEGENFHEMFKEGKSFGKKDGTGLGLFHARTTVESWGGSIECKSNPGVETTFIIRLPSVVPPTTFVESIELNKNQKIVIVDDDSSIHIVWKGRLESLKVDMSKVIMFTSPSHFLDWYRDNSTERMTFLFDYEFLSHELNGLDLANKISGSNIYLVTSRFEEEHIRRACDLKKIHLVDKGMIGFVPITYKNLNDEFIFIDDDDLIRMSWKMEADKSNIDLSCFNSVDEFISNSSEFDKDTKIYIDSNLGDNKKGEIESEKIYDLGFKNLYLATGYSKEDIDKPSWIIEIVGKRADFSKTK